jgi:hypothetical protein
MNELVIDEDIKNKIYTIRNVQVILDRDLAVLYEVETRVLKQAVKRNMERFPSDFMFELNDSEIEFMVSQSVIPSKQHLGGAKPFVFTEQGVSAIASILNSKIAVEIHINIIRTFVNMRKFISNNALIFERLDSLENKQLNTDKKIKTILNAIEDKSIKPKQGIFYDGQMFDAYTFVSDLIRSAKSKIILIDNYVDDSVLTLFSKNQNIDVIIYTKNISKQLNLDLKKYNSQYKKIEIKKFENSHDRFLIVDEKELFHLGASLKDLGKKWFAFSKMDLKSLDVLKRLESI